jgi:Carboxypeptidase regulatory-like domain
MKVVSTCLTIILLGGCALAQAPGTLALPNRAALEGVVAKDPDGEPVSKALIELIAENQTEGRNYTAETAADGTFHIANILPGRYRLFAERTGFLDIEKKRSDGRVLSLGEGQELKDVRIRLQAAAVIRGRVVDEDGDPMQGAEVTVLRQTFAAGRRHWEQVGAERTNDLGEYRVAGLAAGRVYVLVNPPPDFRSLIENSGNPSDAPSPPAAEKPAPPSYQTMYYPGTPDRSQATPIQLHAGDDFPVNFALTPSPSLSIKGSVVNLPPRTSATIMLQSRDFNLVMNGAEIHKDGTFVIYDVSPGSYTIQATVEGSTVPMMARETLQVGSVSVEGLRLAPQPGAQIRGRLRLDNENGAKLLDTERVFLQLEPADDDDEGTLAGGDRYSNITRATSDGSFEWTDVPPGRYYVQMVGNGGTNQDWFVKSVEAGGRDVDGAGLSVNGGLTLMDLVVSGNGSVIDGVVTDSAGQPVSNAVVVAVPEARWWGREDRYRQAVSDQGGRFRLHGVPPGDYTLFAWDTVETDAYLNADFLKTYQGQGTPVRVKEGERKSEQLTALHVPEGAQ